VLCAGNVVRYVCKWGELALCQGRPWLLRPLVFPPAPLLTEEIRNDAGWSSSAERSVWFVSFFSNILWSVVYFSLWVGVSPHRRTQQIRHLCHGHGSK